VDQLGPESRIILNSFPYLTCAVCVAMAYQFSRGRLLLASVGVAALYWLIQTHLQVSLDNPDAAHLFLVASLALPLLTLYLLLIPERGVISSPGLMFAACGVALVGICFPLAGWIGGGEGGLAALFEPRLAEGYVLSRGATILCVLVGLVGLTLLLLRNAEAEAALLGVLLSGYCALAFLHLAFISVVMASSAGLCLAWGLARSSHSMAYRDELTGLLSRRALNERLNSLGRRYSIAMLDVDHFKRFNDTHGHDVGDEVLKLVASRVKQVGNGGTAYRYGGEEFCIVFPRKSTEDCAEALDEVRERIAGYKMSIRDRKRRPVKAKQGSRQRGATRISSKCVSVTISAGVAASSAEFSSPEDVLSAADSKLYRAKKAGRNKVMY
jgi:diguanylate cyclase (GGDEF)-like protein